MSGLAVYLSLPPIQRAFLVFITAGISFPIAGVFIIELELVPLRFALMHGALLGGILDILLGCNFIFFPFVINIILILLIGPFSLRSGVNVSAVSAFFMTTSIALAFLLINILNVPAKDAFAIFWGNIYALTPPDVAVIILIAAGIILFTVFQYRKILAVLFSRDIAHATGINSRIFYFAIITLTGVIVALSIKIIGALLVDCLLLLPAISALFFADSFKKLFFLAAAIGLASAVTGFLFSLSINSQPSPAVTMAALLISGILFLIRKIKTREKKKT